MSIAFSMSNEEAKAAVSKLIGTKYSEAARAEIAKLTGRACVVGPDEAHSMVIDETRIHVEVDDNGVITGVRFG
ncbi:hypothetical protein [Pseudomonas putida]|uniref:Peptidase inhibitor I78 family protein n=1 Tax=Pseudomonas putida TaxID=303 RepID=A0A1Q9QXQ2_PSEPU|nr:hypothetical protein [Pseudomonas putida]OLS59915.1 hypothetical protein PSEMO_52230 [Pseudomonas putida]